MKKDTRGCPFSIGELIDLLFHNNFVVAEKLYTSKPRGFGLAKPIQGIGFRLV